MNVQTQVYGVNFEFEEPKSCKDFVRLYTAQPPELFKLLILLRPLLLFWKLRHQLRLHDQCMKAVADITERIDGRHNSYTELVYVVPPKNICEILFEALTQKSKTERLTAWLKTVKDPRVEAYLLPMFPRVLPLEQYRGESQTVKSVA